MVDMTRLVVGGCSCTRHCWPTWADYLGKHYESYINTGQGGSDNATIARNIIDTAKPNDLVVVQWTGFDRFNMFDDNKTPNYHYSDNLNAESLIVEQCGMTPDTARGSWLYNGSVLSNKLFLKHFYSPIERFRNTLDVVRSVVMHSELVGYKLFNFTMTNWFTGELELTVDPRLVSMHQRENFSNFYLKNNLISIRDEIGYQPVTHKYCGNSSYDTHPQPWTNWIWLKEHIAPTIGVNLDLTIENQVKLDQQRVLNGDVD
jgi:hypothetical protein